MKFIDAHCHLDGGHFGDLNALLTDIRAVGVEKIIIAGVDLQTSEFCREFAKVYDMCRFTAGFHPTELKNYKEGDLEKIAEIAQDKRCVAIGEIGLDYHYDLSPRAIQKGAFREQIELADTLGLPVVLHIREAYEDARQILFEARRYLNNGVLLHCYSGSKEFVKVFSELDAYFAFGGAITFNNAKHNLEAMKAVPLDRLMLETDCPYMTPVPYRGKTNYPRLVNLVADKACEVLELPREEIERITTENTKRLFIRMK